MTVRLLSADLATTYGEVAFSAGVKGDAWARLEGKLTSSGTDSDTRLAVSTAACPAREVGLPAGLGEAPRGLGSRQSPPAGPQCMAARPACLPLSARPVSPHPTQHNPTPPHNKQVLFDGPGTIVVDVVSLFPAANVERGRQEGHANPWPFRQDLLGLLSDLKPA